MVSLIRNYYEKIRSLSPPYPGLKYKVRNEKRFWEGDLKFIGTHDSERIKDSFAIQIELHKQGLPTVKEIDGRINAMYDKMSLESKRDLHVSPDTGILCLCAKPEEKRKFPGKVETKRFIKELVVPFFFALSYFEETGEWLWGEYSHGHIGTIEYYLENRGKNDPELLKDCIAALNMDFEKFKRLSVNKHMRCWCAIKGRFKKCHPEAFDGLKQMVEDANNM